MGCHEPFHFATRFIKHSQRRRCAGRQHACRLFDARITEDAVADVVVSGAGSQLITTDNRVNGFVLGGGTGNFVKKGTLTVNNGGAVIAGAGTGTIDIATTADSEGAINIGGAAGQAAAKAGTLSAGKIKFGAGNGALNFNHIENNYDFGIALEGNGTVSQIGSGKTTLTTNQTGFTGKTLVQSGILAVDHTLGGTMDVSGGRLQGIGTIGDTVLSKGGVIAVSNASLGTLTVDGDYTGKGGLLEIETVLGDDTSATDKLVITGNSSGDTDVRVINRDGLGAQTDKGIKIIEVGGQSDGTFALVSDYTTKDGKRSSSVVPMPMSYLRMPKATRLMETGIWSVRFIRPTLLIAAPATAIVMAMVIIVVVVMVIILAGQ